MEFQNHTAHLAIINSLMLTAIIKKVCITYIGVKYVHVATHVITLHHVIDLFQRTKPYSVYFTLITYIYHEVWG